MRQTESDKCKHCGEPLPSQYKGPCPKCGEKGKSVTVKPRSLKSRIIVHDVTISIRTGLSLDQIWAANHFARLSERIERTADRNKLHEHRAYVIGAVISAVAFLEAAINELYIDATEKAKYLSENYPPDVVNTLVEIWEELEKSLSILKKYQLALTISKKQKFDTGKAPHQDVQALINLRNALVHFKPEWDTQLRRHKEIEDALRGRFPLCPFAKGNDVFFPKKCLGHGCAEWAVTTAKEFVLEFFSRMGLQAKLESISNAFSKL